MRKKEIQATEQFARSLFYFYQSVCVTMRRVVASLEETVGELLRARGLTLTVAESCTGGLVGDLLTNVPGSSVYYLGGVVTYAYGAKTILLDLAPEFLLEQTSVSEAVVLAMARNVRARLNADIGLATTGIAGPGGGTPDKPVGTAFIALATKDYETSRRIVSEGDRIENKRAAANAALTLLKEYLESVVSRQ